MMHTTVLLWCCVLLLVQLVSAAPPTFSQTTALTATEDAPTTFVPNFITRLLDGDGGTDGFTGTAADAIVVNYMPNSLFFSVLPTITPPTTACDPFGCNLGLTYTLAPFASGTVTFQVQVTDAAGEVGAVATTTLVIAEVNNAPEPTLDSSVGSVGNPVTIAENAGAQANVVLLSAPIPPGPPATVTGTAPFGGESGQTIASITCVAADGSLFDAGGQPVVDTVTGQLSYTPLRNRVGTTSVTCLVLDSADDSTTTADDASFTFFIQLVAGQDCADGQAGAVACNGLEQTCFDDNMPNGDDTLNNDFVCICNNGGQRANRQAAPTCDDCAPGSAGATFCADMFLPARWFCVDTDPASSAQGGFTCNCTNGGGQGTTPATCDDCAAGAIGAVTCAPTSYCVDNDNADPSQQNSFQCVCNNDANRAAPANNAQPGANECDDCATSACGVGQSCTDPDNGDPTSQLNQVCRCNNGGGTGVGAPAPTCDDCGSNPNICGPGQQCVDPDTSPAVQGNYQCQCNNGGGQGVGGPAVVCNDCASSPCGVNQFCNDPNPSPASQVTDYTCTCNTGINYGTGGGVAIGSSASCPIPPRFVPGPSIRVQEDLAQVFTNGAWLPGPSLNGGFSGAWATFVSDSEGPGFTDSNTQAKQFQLTYVTGTANGAGDGTQMFADGMTPAIDAEGRLSFMLRPNAFGSVTYSVLLVDSGHPSGLPALAAGAICPGLDVWCISNTSTLTIVVEPENDPPSFNCTNSSITVLEDSGSVVIADWAHNISAGQYEPLQGLEFRVHTDNPGLFSTQPYIDYIMGSTSADLKFTPLPDAEGVAEIDIELWDSGQDVGGVVRRRVGRCKLVRIVVQNVNDKPTFSNNGAVTIVEDSSLTVFEAWATQIKAGKWAGSRGNQAVDEQDREVYFSVNYTDPADARKFLVPPYINPQSGDLFLHPAPDQNTFGGPVVLNVTLVDSGGLASDSYLLTVVILPVDDAPSFVPGPSVITVNEDSPLYREIWATQVKVGPLFEGVGPAPLYENQTVFFETAVEQGDLSLFAPGWPLVHPNGTLEFQLAQDQFGSATVSVKSFDIDPVTGVTLAGTAATVVINVLPVNDPPSFEVFKDVILIEKGSPRQAINRYLTHIVTGPDNEVRESLTFDVFVNDSTLFTADGQPTVVYAGGSTAGLEYQPAADKTGVVNVTIRAIDNGGTERNGSDVFTKNILIIVTNVNNVPEFVRGQDITVLEDQCNYPNSCNFSNWATFVTPGVGERSTQDANFQVKPFNDEIFMVEIKEQFLTIPPFFIPGALPIDIVGHNKTLYNQFVAISNTGQPYNLPGRLYMYTMPNVSGASLVTATLVDDGENYTLPIKESLPQTFTVRVIPVNDPPSFVTGPQIYLDECVTSISSPGSCRYTYPGWAKRISPGPPDESGQRVIFTVETNQPEIFKVLPTIDGVTGTLNFELAPYAHTAGRSVGLLISACDTGGTLNGGVDCVLESFNLSIGTTDAPARFVPGDDVIALEDEDFVRRRFWARNATLGRTAGVPNSGLAVIQCFADDPSLIASGPNVSLPEGDLIFVPAPDQHGSTLVTCPFGNDTSRAQFVVTIMPVNDQPTFSIRNLTIPLTNYTSAAGGNVLIGAQGGNLSNNSLGLFDPNLFWARGTLASNTSVVPFPGVIPGSNLLPGPSGSYGVVTQFTSNYVISGRDIVVLENWDGKHPGYVVRYIEPSSISVGPPDEVLQQAYDFEMDCGGDSEMFSTAPEVSSSGVISFHLRPRRSGIAQCRLTLVDTGTTERGGVRRSGPFSFSIIIIDVNSPPEYIRGPNVVVKEDHEVYSRSWASAVYSGGDNELQQVALDINISSTQLGLFALPPFFQPWPTPSVLTFQAAPDQFGVIHGYVAATDSGGARSTINAMTITILPVNDAPTFTLSTQRILLVEDAAEYNQLFVTQITPGPTNELTQELHWEVTPVGLASKNTFGTAGRTSRLADMLQMTTVVESFIDVPGGLFISQPRIIAPNPFIGTDAGLAEGHNLTFILQPDAWGSQEMRICLVDNGGTTNGGVDRTCKQFFIDVSSVNDPPRAVTSGVIEIYEDSGVVTIPAWLSILNAGPIDEGLGTVRVLGTTCPSSPSTAIFAVPPVTFFPSGDVTLQLFPDAFGEVNCTVTAEDAGGAVAQIPMRIIVHPINDPPTFSALSDLVEWNEDGGVYDRLFAVGLSPGPTNENLQRIYFAFSPISGRLPLTRAPDLPTNTITYPYEDPRGIYTTLFDESVPLELRQSATDPKQAFLRFKPKPDAYGEVTMNILVFDDAAAVIFNSTNGVNVQPGRTSLYGTTAWLPTTFNSNLDGLKTLQLTIRILPVNDAPVFTLVQPTIQFFEDRGGATEVVSLRDRWGEENYVVPANSVVSQGWAVSVAPGPANEVSQSVDFVILWPVTNSSLFFSPPAVHYPSGDLILPLKPNAFGEITLSIKAVDNGGRERGGIDESPAQSLRVIIDPVNDPPFIEYGSHSNGNSITLLEDIPKTFTNYAQLISPGLLEETTQTVVISNAGAYDTALIEVLSFFPDGTLSVTPKKDQNGVTSGFIQLKDNGGTLNGGIDTGFANVSITVLPVNDPPTLSLQKTEITVDEDCGKTFIRDVIQDVSPGPPDEFGQQIFFRVVTTAPEQFVELPEMDATGILSFSVKPDFSGAIPIQIQACDTGGDANGGVPCSNFFSFTINVIAINDRPFFTPGAPFIATPNNIGIFVLPWASNIRAGPADEDQSDLKFITTNLRDPTLFIDGGAPSIDADGVLRFEVNNLRSGNTTATFHLQDKEGLMSPEYQILIEIFDPSEAPLVAVLDQLYDDFSIRGFQQSIGRAMDIDPDCVVILKTQPATVRVNFRFTRECGRFSASFLNNEYLNRVADPASALNTELRILSSFSEGVRNTQVNQNNLKLLEDNVVLENGRYVERDDEDDNRDTLVIILVIFCVVIFVLVIGVIFCVRRYLRRRRWEADNATYEEGAAAERAYEDRVLANGGEVTTVDNIAHDPDLILEDSQGNVAQVETYSPGSGVRIYHQGSPRGNASSIVSAVSYLSNSQFLTALQNTDSASSEAKQKQSGYSDAKPRSSLISGGVIGTDEPGENPIDVTFSGSAPPSRRGSLVGLTRHGSTASAGQRQAAARGVLAAPVATQRRNPLREEPTLQTTRDLDGTVIPTLSAAVLQRAEEEAWGGGGGGGGGGYQPEEDETVISEDDTGAAGVHGSEKPPFEPNAVVHMDSTRYDEEIVIN